MAAAAIENASKTAPSLGSVAAVVAGNALDFYDFLTYSFFAAQIGRAFFPSDNANVSLLASLATFGAGFLTRPLGAWVIGGLADRVGRKAAMLLSFSLMGCAIVGLALTPSYRAIGIAAPILAIGFRLLQGFALGGEVGPSTAYLIEAAPAHRRGLYVSLQYMGQDASVLCAGLVGVGLAGVMSEQALVDYGWRIAFLVGAVIVPFGLILRRRLAETLHAGDPAEIGAAPAGARAYMGIAVLGGLMLAATATLNYLLIYLTTYAETTLRMSSKIAFGATVVLGLTNVLFDPVGGWLSDRFGRKPMVAGSLGLLLILAPLCFQAIVYFHTAAVLFGAVVVMAILTSLSSGPALTALTESLPRSIRSGVMGLVYAIAMSIFGGTAQFNVAWLTAVTRNPLAPAWYLSAGVAIGMLAMLGLRESAPAVLARRGRSAA